MKAVVLMDADLTVCDIPVPGPKPHEVLVRVRACRQLNRVDLILVRGRSQGEHGIIPALEWAGEVAECGADVPAQSGQVTGSWPLAVAGMPNTRPPIEDASYPSLRRLWSFEEAATLPLLHLRAEGGGKPIIAVLTGGDRHEQIALEALLHRGAIRRVGRASTPAPTAAGR